MIKTKSEEEIKKRIVIYERLRKLCRELKYRPSEYWYQAKIEALLWTLGYKYPRLKFVEWEN